MLQLVVGEVGPTRQTPLCHNTPCPGFKTLHSLQHIHPGSLYSIYLHCSVNILKLAPILVDVTLCMAHVDVPVFDACEESGALFKDDLDDIHELVSDRRGTWLEPQLHRAARGSDDKSTEPGSFEQVDKSRDV